MQYFSDSSSGRRVEIEGNRLEGIIGTESDGISNLDSSNIISHLEYDTR